MSKFKDKVALITGSGRGIGRALALKLAGEGARIVVNDLDEEPAADVVREIQSLGGLAVACVGSVREASFGERFVETALKTYNGLDIIVNNAGYTNDGLIQKQTDEQFQEMLDVHTLAPFRILRAATEPIRAFAKRDAEQGKEVFRKVVNISSMSGTHGNAGQINYSTAKSSLIGLTKTLSKEWGRYKVNVNCVAFGFIDTRLTKVNTDPTSTIRIEGRDIKVGVPQQAMASAPQMIPLGRPGKPEEAAGAIYLFCTPESDYISGQVVLVAGGAVF